MAGGVSSGSGVTRPRDVRSPLPSDDFFRRTTDAAPCAIVVYEGGRLRYANAAAQALTGYATEDLVGRPPWEIVHPAHRDLVRGRAGARLAGQPVPPRYEFKLLRKDGQERWVDFSAAVTAHGGQAAIVGVAVDITSRKVEEERVRHLAYRDPLTGLANRSLLSDHIALALADGQRRGGRVGVLYLDLDGFKEINDTLSHAAGDQVLERVGERLRSAVRQGDTVARLGGDEFVVLLAGIGSPEDAAAVGEKVRDLVRQPILFGEREIVVTASVGISIFPEDGTDSRMLLANADAALIRAKEHGGGLQFYTPALHEAALDRLSLQKGLRRAVEREELALHYQPVLGIRTGHPYGVEALLRWHHPVRGLLTPREFLAAMETSTAAVPIGLWTLRTACSQVRSWQALGHPHLHVGVNLAARQLQQPGFLPQVADVLAETGLAAEYLDLEITEDHATLSPGAAQEALHGLVALGTRISLDNFGRGTSSLRQLKGLPLRAVKIDRSCVRDLVADGSSMATAIVRLVRTLKLDVVGAGVETAEELQSLAALDCDRAQGYVYSPPLAGEQCTAFLMRHPGA